MHLKFGRNRPSQLKVQRYRNYTVPIHVAIVYYGCIFFVVTVYSKNCSDVDTVGPTWYRLDTVGSTGTSGRFYPPAIKSGAVIADDVSRVICAI